MPSYRSIIREKTFLDVANRSKQVGPGRIQSIAYSDNIIQFSLQGLTDTYTEYIRVMALDSVNTAQYTLAELTDLITNSDLEVACTCPAFLYWGFQYVSAVDNYGLWIATISPDIRNPQLKGGGCKHIHSILNTWPDFAAEIATLYPYRIEVPTAIRRRSNNKRERINVLFNRMNKLRYG